MNKILFLILLVWTSLACNRQADQDPDSGVQAHEHDELSSTYTLFSESLEFYVEHPALVAGEESEILVHLTRTDSYEPCSKGTVSIHIDGLTFNSGQASTPGIYEIPFTPERGGEFHAEISYMETGLEESVEAHMDVYSDHADMHEVPDDPAGHEHSPEQEGEITYLKEDAWQSDFLVEKIQRGPFHTVIPTSGELMPMPGEKASISSTTRGMVHFADPKLVQGAQVKQGQLLFFISSESLVEDNLRLRYEEIKNKLDKSRSTYLRHRQLYNSEAISRRQYLESRTIYIQDSLNFYNLDSQISKEGIHIVAPASGSIHELPINDGMHVTEGDVLAILSPDRNLLLRADLPQHFFQYAASISTANFRPAYSSEVLAVGDLEGKLMAVGHSVKENDHYLPVNFLLKNDGRLLEGAFVEVYLIAEERENVLTVPVTALGEEQGGNYVFVQVSGESYSKRRVQTGPGDGQRVEILTGLVEGERVVTRGSILVKAASMKTGEIDHGHSH